MLLPPLLAGAAVLCMLLAVAVSFSQDAKTKNPLAKTTHDELARQITADLEGTPTPADIRRAQKPLSERQRLLAAHPYFALYKIAKHRFGVSWYLVAAVHYQDTGFSTAPKTLAHRRSWQRYGEAGLKGIVRPSAYPNRSDTHPSIADDFDVVMAIAADLKAGGARSLGNDAQAALLHRYGSGPDGRLATAMVIERARAWSLLGTLPLPGSGELATPVKGVVGGCGYFGCPRRGHLHNGIDFLAPTGTPIRAAGDGTVASVEPPGESGGYGNFVCIQHRPHLASCYAHMSAFAKDLRAGVRVTRGQVIGLVGSTGSSSAPHLHFEVRRGPAACSACAVDPLPLLSGDVPDAALPELVAEAPAVTGASSTGPIAAIPPAQAPAPVPTAPAPASATPTEPTEPSEPAQPAATPARRTPSSHGSSTTGGATPKAPATPYTATTPATPAPAATPAAHQPPPPQQQPAAPPPAPPANETTGGASPNIPPAEPPPPPPQQPPPQQQP